VVVLSGVVPVFTIIALGALARRLGWIDERFVSQLNLVVYNLALPALLVHLIGRTPLEGGLLGPVVEATLGATLVCGLVAWAVMAWRRQPPRRLGVVVQAAIRGNLAYVAFPVILSAGGEPALRLAAVVSAVLIPFQNLISITALAVGRGGSLVALVRTVLLNPVVLAIAGGLLWSLSGWGGFSWLNSFLGILGDLAMPGALLALGGQLRLERLRQDVRAAAFSTVIKLAVCPAIGYLGLSWLGVDAQGLMVGTLLLAAPTAVASVAVVQGMDGDLDLAGAAVVASSLGSFPAFILWGLVVSAS
jgi:malate permease and related proteins